MGLPAKLFWIAFVAMAGLGLAAALIELLWPGAGHVRLNSEPVSGAAAFWTALAAGAIPGLLLGGFAYGIAFVLRPAPAADLP